MEEEEVVLVGVEEEEEEEERIQFAVVKNKRIVQYRQRSLL